MKDNNLKLLAIDTSTNTCSVALISNNQIHTSELPPCASDQKPQHTKQILPQIQTLLKQANIRLDQLNALAFSCGPGSFTGIRLGASVIQGLAFGVNVPVVPISTLQVIAQAAYVESGAERVIVATDAYAGKIYCGMYCLEKNRMLSVQPDAMFSVEEMNVLLGARTAPLQELRSNSKQENIWTAIGNAWQKYPELLTNMKNIVAVDSFQYSQAKYVATLALEDFKAGKFCSAELALPVYLYGAGQWQSA